MDQFLNLDPIIVTWNSTVSVTSENNSLDIEVPIPTKVWLVGLSHQGHDMELMFVNFLN